ncbi:hypothetical protein Dimus_038738 [Dionaea muscipula]
MEITMDAMRTMIQELLAQSEEKMMRRIDELKGEMRAEWREDMGRYLEKGKSTELGTTSTVVEPPLPPNPHPSPNSIGDVLTQSPRPNPTSLSPNSSYPHQQSQIPVSTIGYRHSPPSHREALSPPPTNHPPPTCQPQSPPYYPPPKQYYPPPFEEHPRHHYPRLDFPPFDGANPRSWVRKAERYFSLMSVAWDKRVEYAVMSLMGRAENWFYGYSETRRRIDWEEFNRCWQRGPGPPRGP